MSNLLQQDGLAKREATERFGVFGRLNYGMSLSTMINRDHVELWDWIPESGVPGRFALVHGLERINNDDGTRRVFFRRVADLIQEREIHTHRRSIVVGDFNANPFESAVFSSDGLHAVGVRHVNNQTSRTVRLGEDREDFFYNPMWRRYGHVGYLESGTATHYWQNSLAGEIFWHMLDQVVIRPEECPRFPEEQLQILTRIGTVELLAPDGTLDTRVGSDHLPIIFQWNL